jgi:hypothetical protein
MKKIFKSIVVFSLFATLFSCSEEDKATIYAKGAPSLTGDKVSLNYQDDVNRVSTALPISMKFEWTKANYTGAKTPYSYTLEIPAKYPNPKNMEEIRDTIIFVETFNDTVTSYEATRAIFRNRILRLNAIKAIDVTKTNKIVFRLKSFVGTNGSVMYSNNFEFTLNP